MRNYVLICKESRGNSVYVEILKFKGHCNRVRNSKRVPSVIGSSVTTMKDVQELFEGEIFAIATPN